MIKLSKISTKPPKGSDQQKIEAETAKLTKKIGALVETMLAQKKHSLLIVFQGMDASGKDGAFKNVFCEAPLASFLYKSYGKPTDEEFAHDFLWRIHKNAPAKGQVSISVRSHYEDILIQRVHDWIDDNRVAVRMNAINAYEQLLRDDNNTTVLKFFLHISAERQLEKLAERIEVPEKNWKHKDGDWEERKLWDKYMKAYEFAINKSTIPWNIVPVDSRWYRDYIVAKKVYEVLSKMKLTYPVIPADSPSQELLKAYKASQLSKTSDKEKIDSKSKKAAKKNSKQKPISTNEDKNSKSGVKSVVKSILKKASKKAPIKSQPITKNSTKKKAIEPQKRGPKPKKVTP